MKTQRSINGNSRAKSLSFLMYFKQAAAASACLHVSVCVSVCAAKLKRIRFADLSQPVCCCSHLLFGILLHTARKRICCHGSENFPTDKTECERFIMQQQPQQTNAHGGETNEKSNLRPSVLVLAWSQCDSGGIIKLARMRQHHRQSKAKQSKANVWLLSWSSQPIRRSGVGIWEAAYGQDLRLWMKSWKNSNKKRTPSLLQFGVIQHSYQTKSLNI